MQNRKQNEMENKLSINGCEGEDVIAFSTGMYRADQISGAFEKQLRNISNQLHELLKSQKIEIYPNIYQEGIDCEILGANSVGWKKGKVKIKFELEFIPDEIEDMTEGRGSEPTSDSSLDSLRTVAN
jgi:hypothetical protein